MSEVPPDADRAGERGELPRVFGRYVLFDQIGRGGMAEIFLARADTHFGGSRLVVVKQILPELTRDASFERMFVSEAKLAARLRNANVVQVFDLGREAERLFITMEYVEGFDLHQLLRELSRSKVALPAQFALFVVREVLGALAYAHRANVGPGQRGVVHRDVSPSNVLISFEGEVKLCDFGIARALTDMIQHPHAHEDVAPNMAGKSAYMAPEQARGEEVGAQADLFAVGILLWELFAGRRLYKGTPDETLALARRAEIPPIPRSGLPAQEELQELLDQALAKDPSERFASAIDMQRAVDAYAVQAGLLASQLRFSAFLKDHFAERILDTRRENERAAQSFSSMLPPLGEEVSDVKLPPPSPTGSARMPDILPEPEQAPAELAEVTLDPMDIDVGVDEDGDEAALPEPPAASRNLLPYAIVAAVGVSVLLVYLLR